MFRITIAWDGSDTRLVLQVKIYFALLLKKCFGVNLIFLLYFYWYICSILWNSFFFFNVHEYYVIFSFSNFDIQFSNIKFSEI
jgi:hypothetical protein